MRRSPIVVLIFGWGLGLACGLPFKNPFERCLAATPEPFWVEPVTPITDEAEVMVEVHIGNGEKVTVVTETGAWMEVGPFGVNQPALVRVRLVPDTTHHLEVTAWVAETTGPGGCKQGGYTLSTKVDKYGVPLLVMQVESK
jgi:hypothetical protein